MIASIYHIDIPPTVTVTSLVMSIGTTVTAGPYDPPDPPANTFPNRSVIMKPKGPFDHLDAEQHRRRSKQARKAKRPAWRR